MRLIGAAGDHTELRAGTFIRYGSAACTRIIDYARLISIADEVDTPLLVDMSHISYVRRRRRIAEPYPTRAVRHDDYVKEPEPSRLPFSRAGVTQLAECLLPKQDVAGSNPVSRSNSSFDLPA